jgi:uncharacterized protein YjiS (DUF1127 family)
MTSRTQIDFTVMGGVTPRRGPAWPLLADGIRAVARRWRERRILEELDDRILRDIGISRSEALYEARKPFWVS